METRDGCIVIDNYQPTQWEWTEDISKFRKDGWNYTKEWPDGRLLIGRIIPVDGGGNVG